MSADEDKKFNDEDFQLKDWLVSRGVDRTKAEKAEPTLLASGFDMPSTLLGITVEELTKINKTISDKQAKLSVALIRHLHNKLQQQQIPQQIPQQDVTAAWEFGASTAIPDLSTVSTATKIKNLVFAPPSNNPAAVSQHYFQKWKSVISEDVLRLYFRPVATHETCEILALYISTLLLLPDAIVGENEDGYHSRIDQCVTTPMKRFAPSFTLQRNCSQDSSSHCLYRPDFTATLLGRGCFFRGEEKKSGSSEDPRAELHEKLGKIWPFPGLPFVLGYFSVGVNLTFACVYKDRTVPLGNPLQLDQVQDRLECWNAVRNITRIMKYMASTALSILPYDLQDIRKGSPQGTDWERTISFSGGHVQKCIHLRDEQTENKAKRLYEVLSILQRGVDGVQPIVSFKFSSSVADKRKRRKVPPTFFIVATFGASIERVENTDHLRRIVVFLLNMKRRLESLGITHRDIRLPNILSNSTTNQLGLIDWDDSVKGLHNLPNADVAHLDPKSHAPEMFGEGRTHDHTVDLWSIGYLIQKNSTLADEPLRLLMNEFVKPANQRPVVTEEMVAMLARVE